MSRFGLRTRLGIIREYSESGYGYDGDALHFIRVAGITNSTIVDAVNDLFIDLKLNNIYNKFYALYLATGATATENKWNAVNPDDTNAAFRLTFSGGITHASTGMTFNGTTGYADSFLNISSSVSNWHTDHHLAIYMRTQQPSVGDGWHMGVGDASNGLPLYGMAIRRFSSNANDRIYDYGNISGNGRSSDSTTDARGFYIASAIANNDHKLYRNGTAVLTSTSTATGTPSNASIHIGRINPTAGSALYLQGEMALISIGKGLSSSEVTIYNSIVQAYQGKLSRQV